jgi:hypothetical protein
MIRRAREVGSGENATPPHLRRLAPFNTEGTEDAEDTEGLLVFD